ncbi:hypothetical protein C0995_002701, partial [Termitomyces sp. Mi166
MRTLITPFPSQARSSSRKKPKTPSIIIPRTPININQASTNHNKIVPVLQISPSTSTTPQLFTTPLSFASTVPPPSQESGMEGSTLDILALAELFATLKRAVSCLYATFDELGDQTRKLAHLAPVMQVDHQIENARLVLEQQITSHQKSMQEVKQILEEAVCESMVERLKAQIYETISDIVAKEVQSRVQQELFKQIPERLIGQVQGHTRGILEVHAVLCNSEARCHNASLRSPCMDAEPLHPLLRPLPSALQSPVYILKRSFTANNSKVATPIMMTPFSVVPTPILGGKHAFELVPPTPSSPFPRDIGLGPGAAKQLLTGHGLETPANAVPSPNSDQIEVKANIGLNTPDASPTLESTTREEDINKFMNHIGLPFLMIPVPKSKSVSNQYQIKNVLSYATRPLWDEADGPKNIIPHYYAEGMKMDHHACQLHGWKEREARDNVKVMDAVLMSSELDLLEIRMNELDSVVDNFFIIESNATFTGLPKEVYFAKNRERFSKFEKKIIYKLQVHQHIILPGYPLSGQVAWDVERWTRNNMTAMLHAHMNSLPSGNPILVIMSDIDEIPSKHTIELLRACDYGEAIHLQLRNFLY